jgi:hypothetical protein
MITPDDTDDDTLAPFWLLPALRNIVMTKDLKAVTAAAKTAAPYVLRGDIQRVDAVDHIRRYAGNGGLVDAHGEDTILKTIGAELPDVPPPEPKKETELERQKKLMAAQQQLAAMQRRLPRSLLGGDNLYVASDDYQIHGFKEPDLEIADLTDAAANLSSHDRDALDVASKPKPKGKKPAPLSAKPAAPPALASTEGRPSATTKFSLKPLPFETKDTKRKGAGIVPSLLNTIKAVSDLGVSCRYDVFHDKLIVGAHDLSLDNIADVCLMVRTKIAQHFAFEPSQDTIEAAVRRLCLEHRFDPVVDYLDSLKWDGINRLDTMMPVYFKTENEPLNCAIGRKMMIAAVRRAKKPGCKFDYIVVMDISEQGKKKSTAIEVLAGSENFSDMGILDANEKTQMELIQGVWLYEIGELSGMGRADVNRVKMFASRKVDRARPAYGKVRVDRPRRCIFIGSTNDDEYLKDTTGNRRIWPITPGDIDVEALTRDRNQLWAEAVTIEATGEELPIPEKLWPDMAARQASRLTSHPWEDRLQGLTHKVTMLVSTSSSPDIGAGKYATLLNADGKEELRASSDWILTDQLQIPPDRLNEGQANTLKAVMRKLGWTGPSKMRIGEGAPSVRGYKKPHN